MREHCLGKTDQEQPNILAVIVLYKTLPNESVAFTTLIAGLERAHQPGDKLQVLLFDNTPGAQVCEDLPGAYLGIYDSSLS